MMTWNSSDDCDVRYGDTQIKSTSQEFKRESGMVESLWHDKSDNAESRSQPAFWKILPALKRTFPALAERILQHD
ncbi:hypothetical protein Pelo_18033 [Pelomyxa schiedti]|nr:hypothetical protein Pelo_18033 [Pelomyxa schiedti]